MPLSRIVSSPCPDYLSKRNKASDRPFWEFLRFFDLKKKFSNVDSFNKDGLQLIEQEMSKVSAEKSRAAAVNSNEMSLTKLAKLTFWEEFHQNGKNDWFLDHTQVFQILKEDVRLMVSFKHFL